MSLFNSVAHKEFLAHLHFLQRGYLPIISLCTCHCVSGAEQTSYSACMLALVSSKAHSTDSGLRDVTLLHSICRLSLERTGSSRVRQHHIQSLSIQHFMIGHQKSTIPVSVVLFEGWEGSQRVIELGKEGTNMSPFSFVNKNKLSKRQRVSGPNDPSGSPTTAQAGPIQDY